MRSILVGFIRVHSEEVTGVKESVPEEIFCQLWELRDTEGVVLRPGPQESILESQFRLSCGATLATPKYCSDLLASNSTGVQRLVTIVSKLRHNQPSK